MKLYELTGEYIQLMQMLEDASVEDETEIMAAMEAVSGDIEDKADAYARIMKNLIADIDALDSEEKRLKSRRNTLETRVDRLKMAIQDAMTLTGKRKLKTSIGNWGIQKNPPSVKVNNQDVIPAEYWTTPAPTLNRKAILEDMKQGVIVDGCEIQQTEGLRFR